MMADKPPNHPAERICAFYSKGPHFVRMLKRLRAEYPDEILVATIPFDFPFSVVEGMVNETLRLPEEGTSATLVRNVRIVRILRQARCSHIVVMFDSPRLNLLARVSGAAKRWCFPPDGRLRPLTRPLPQLLLGPCWLRVYGQMNYLRAWLGSARKCRIRE